MYAGLYHFLEVAQKELMRLVSFISLPGILVMILLTQKTSSMMSFRASLLEASMLQPLLYQKKAKRLKVVSILETSGLI